MELNPLTSNLLAIAAMVAGLLIAGWWVIGLYSVRGRKQEKEPPEADLPGRQHEVVSGVPLVLIIFYTFIGISLVGYVLYIWLGGISY